MQKHSPPPHFRPRRGHESANHGEISPEPVDPDDRGPSSISEAAGEKKRKVSVAEEAVWTSAWWERGFKSPRVQIQGASPFRRAHFLLTQVAQERRGDLPCLYLRAPSCTRGARFPGGPYHQNQTGPRRTRPWRRRTTPQNCRVHMWRRRRARVRAGGGTILHARTSAGAKA